MDLSDCFWQEVIFCMFLFLSLSLSKLTNKVHKNSVQIYVLNIFCCTDQVIDADLFFFSLKYFLFWC